MVELTNLEVCKSVSNITEDNNKFELNTDNCNRFSFTELRDEVAVIYGFAKITPKLVQHDIVGLRVVKAYENLGFERSATDGYLIIIKGYGRSSFRDSESYVTNLVALDEKNIPLTLKQYNSFFVIYRKSLVIYTIKGI